MNTITTVYPDIGQNPMAGDVFKSESGGIYILSEIRGSGKKPTYIAFNPKDGVSWDNSPAFTPLGAIDGLTFVGRNVKIIIKVGDV